MKKIFAYILVLIIISSFNGQPENQSLLQESKSYRVGEKLKYRVHYGIFNAAFATLEVKESNKEKASYYHVVGKGRTSGALRLFFRVEDLYETYINKETNLPKTFIRKINEGGYKKDKTLSFDHIGKKVTVNNKKKNKISTYDIPADAQDMLSTFYYLRNVNTDNYRTNDFIKLNVFMDEEVIPFKLMVMGRESIKTKFGRIDCIKIRPFVPKGRIFEAKESVTIWVSDDKNHIPVKIKADLAVGNLTADLNEYKNLKHKPTFR